jgi:hypothetical protein
MRRGLAIAMAIAASGCPPRQVRDDGGTTDAQPPDPGPPPVCGHGNERASDYAFLPADAHWVAAIDLQSADLDAALAKLRAHVATAGLPVQAAFALGQWHWQVPLLRGELSRFGIDSGELVAFAGSDAAGGSRSVSGWIAPLGCTQDEAIAAVRAHGWAIEDAGTIAVVAAVPQKSAWDLVVGPGAIAVLAAGGHGREIAARVGARPAPSPELVAAPSPAARLGALASAPVRIVVVGRGFTTDGTLSPGGARALRATADSVDDVALNSTQAESPP